MPGIDLSQPIVVLITAPSQEIAGQIASLILEKRLAACVNLLSPVRSLYIWEGKVNDDNEVLLIVKSRADLFKEQLVPAVRSVHPYEVPEIIALPILIGSEDYLEWIRDVTL